MRWLLLATVTLEIFSGRPNPEWSLDPTVVAELSNRLERLPVADTVPSTPGLGYRGVRVERSDGSVIEVGAGHATITRPDGAQLSRSDADAGLETWLLDTGRDTIPDALWRLTPAGRDGRR